MRITPCHQKEAYSTLSNRSGSHRLLFDHLGGAHPDVLPRVLRVIWSGASTAHFSDRRSRRCAVSHFLTHYTSGNLRCLLPNWPREKAQSIALTVKSRRQTDLRRLRSLSAARLPPTSSQDDPNLRIAWKFPINHRSSRYSDTRIKVRCGLDGNLIGARGSVRSCTGVLVKKLVPICIGRIAI
jgi:hypothetical protein